MTCCGCGALTGIAPAGGGREGSGLAPGGRSSLLPTAAPRRGGGEAEEEKELDLPAEVLALALVLDGRLAWPPPAPTCSGGGVKGWELEEEDPGRGGSGGEAPPKKNAPSGGPGGGGGWCSGKGAAPRGGVRPAAAAAALPP